MQTHSFSTPPLFHQYSLGSHDFEPAEPDGARFSTRAGTIKYEILKYLMDNIDGEQKLKKMTKRDKSMMDNIFFKSNDALTKVGKKHLCESYGFVERKLRSGVGDHFFPVRNIGSKISIYGTNNDWNKLPVKGTSNVGYTIQVVKKDLPNGKTELAIFDLELMKIDQYKIVEQNAKDVEGMFEEFDLDKPFPFEDFLGVMLENLRKSGFDNDINDLKNCKFRIISRTGSERSAFWAKFPHREDIKPQTSLIITKSKPKEMLSKFQEALTILPEDINFINSLSNKKQLDQEKRLDYLGWNRYQLSDNQDDHGNLDIANMNTNMSVIEEKIKKECIFILGRKILNGTQFESLMKLVNTNFVEYDTNIRRMLCLYTMEELSIVDQEMSDFFSNKLLDGMSFATWYVCLKHTLQDPWKTNTHFVNTFPHEVIQTNSKVAHINKWGDEVEFQLQILKQIKHFIQWPISTTFKDELRTCLYTLFEVQDSNGIMMFTNKKNTPKIVQPPTRWKCTPLEITIMTSLWEYYARKQGGCMYRELAPHDVIALEELANVSEKKLIEDIQKHPAFTSILNRQRDEL